MTDLNILLGYAVDDAKAATRAVEIGARIASARSAAGLRGTELAALVSLGKDQISKIESGKRRVDVGELPRFAAALGVTVRSLLGQSERPALAMAARLAAGTPPTVTAQARKRARQLLELDDLLTQVSAMPAARSSASGIRVLDSATAQFATIPKTKDEARDQGRALAEMTRRELDLGSDALGDVATLIEQHFAVDVALAPLGEADGLCVQSGGVALILASTDYTDGHVRFTLAHELGHHVIGDPREIIEEASEEMFAGNIVEWRANAFAAHLLMPERGVVSVLDWLGEAPGNVSERSAVALTEHFGVSLSALVCQLTDLGLIGAAAADDLIAQDVSQLLERHPDVATARSPELATKTRRAPERLTREAIAAARSQRLGLSVVASLLQREDDDKLWAEIMGHTAETAVEPISL